MIFGPNRYVCTVLDEMRKSLEQLKNLEPHCKGENGTDVFVWTILSRYMCLTALLIEEAQTMVNRMEEALENWGDIESAKEDRAKLKKELKKLNKQIKERKEKLKEIGGEDES